MFREVVQGIGLDELKRIVLLRCNIHPDYVIETGPMVAHRGTASPTEQVEKPGHQRTAAK